MIAGSGVSFRETTVEASRSSSLSKMEGVVRAIVGAAESVE